MYMQPTLFFGGSFLFDDLLIRHLSGRHIVLLSNRQSRNEYGRTPECQCNVLHRTMSSTSQTGHRSTLALWRTGWNGITCTGEAVTLRGDGTLTATAVKNGDRTKKCASTMNIPATLTTAHCGSNR